jgi:trehalose 6-phosphate synthase
LARLVIVSNRVPNPSERGPRAGGLAVAVADALRPGSLWFGWSGRRSTHVGPARPHWSDGINYATIDLSEAEYQAFYVRFANGVLWPLLHYRLSLLSFRAEDYDAYLAVNRRFAESLVPLLRPDDLIWVHDYHLIPFAETLRALGVTNRIGFFLHTPFVPPALWRALPRAEQLLRAWCAYDVIGFHIEDYRESFLDCVRGVLGLRPDRHGAFHLGGHSVQTLSVPVGIDPDAFAEAAVRNVDTQPHERALAIGVDRLDYSKGLTSRFEAFAQMLTRYPEHRRQVSLLQVAARSREDLRAYQHLRRELDRLVGDTNGQFSDVDWTPLRYITRTMRRPVLAGLFRTAKLGVVTPLRDGMNLVAKEYVAAQDSADPGVLILSCFAGAANDLREALIVNPYDIDAMADALHIGLAMPLAERQERWEALRRHVWHNTAGRFCATFLSHLQVLHAPLVVNSGLVTLASRRPG